MDMMNPNKTAWGECYRLYAAALEEAQHVTTKNELWVWFWAKGKEIMDKYPGDCLVNGLLLAVFEQLEAVAADIAAGTTDTPELQRKDEKTT